MQTLTLHADARASAQELARSERLERRLAKYQPPYGARVRALAEQHPRLADLALSFPALLFALAVPRAGVRVEPAITAVVAGASLREVAEIANLPMWLRPIVATAFEGPIPRLPDGELFRRQIANYLPAMPRHFSTWAQAVSDAYIISDQAVALWVARELHRHRSSVDLDYLRGICVWAWYSRYPAVEESYAPSCRWAPGLSFDSAVRHARNWISRVELNLMLGEDDIGDVWLIPATIDGYQFSPLRSASEIAAEAEVMRNCLGSYGPDVFHNECRLWSIRQNGNRVGTIEVGPINCDPLVGIPQI
jgi:hypothetical protein